MSAIFGIIYKRDPGEMPGDIALMQDALMHRAVDGRSVWRSESAFIGHHQQILNPEQRYEQLPYEEGELVICADAAIFNREELFTNLSIDKSRWPTYPASMLILAAYRKWGEECLKYLEGEFSFVIYNKASGSLFCAVDQIGFRPLYYHDSPEVFIFSSEIKGVIAVKKTPNTFNEDTIIEYYFGQADKSGTYTKGVFALCGGNKLIHEEGRITVNRYWEPQQTGKYHFNKDTEWAECLRDLIVQAVEDRIRTDLPIGVTLSGGLDSSSLACIAGKVLEKKNRPLYAFSSVLPANYKGVATDERKYIEIVGKHIKNIDQTFIQAPDSGIFTGLKEAITADEGIPNGFFYIDQAINHAARQKNVGVMLSGFGGDYFVSWKGNSVIYQLLTQLKVTKAAKVFFDTKQYERASLIQLLKREIIGHSGIYDRIAPLLHPKRIDWNKKTTLNDKYFKRYLDNLIFKSPNDQVAFMKAQISQGAVGKFCSMFSTRDSRYEMTAAVPLFDRRIMEFMFDVPIELFRKNGTRRSLMRNAMDGILPEEIQWRFDKQPYSPDHISRLQGSKQLINTLINEKQYSFVWEYIDKNSILNNIDSLKEVAGMSGKSDLGGIRITQAIICLVFLKWLMVNNYVFSNH